MAHGKGISEPDLVLAVIDGGSFLVGLLVEEKQSSWLPRRAIRACHEVVGVVARMIEVERLSRCEEEEAENLYADLCGQDFERANRLSVRCKGPFLVVRLDEQR